MKIKAKWGFVGDSAKLKADSGKVRSGQVFDDVDKEYAHILIGKGLVEEVPEGKRSDGKADEKPTPKATKPAAPTETK
jgi:hypothetical protein